MKNYRFALIALLFFTLTAAANNLQLYFDRPADFFEESFVVGNGTQGAIVYGNPERERISLNDITFWSGEPETEVFSPGAYKSIQAIREALNKGNYVLAEKLQHEVQGRYTQNYQPIGNLFIDFGNAAQVTDYSRKLDLNTAVATVNYKRGDNPITTEYFASAPDSVIVVNIHAAKPVSFSLSLDSKVKYSVSAASNRITADGYAAYSSMPNYVDGKPEDKLQYDESRAIHFRTNISVKTSNGNVAAKPDGTIDVSDATDATIYINIATNFAGANTNPTTAAIDYKGIADRHADKSVKYDFKKLKKAHIKDYSQLFGRVQLDLGESSAEFANMPTDIRLKAYTDNNATDPDLEELYFQYGRYLLISCSRTSRVPANLQGLWNESLLPPWSSNYTTNINLQENYWPVEVMNLSELHMPMLSFIKQLPVSGEKTAKEYYGVNRGWALGHNTDLWAITNPVGMHGGNPSWANWNMGGAWVASHIWQHYLFTRDIEFLREYYPTLRGAAEFCLDWLVEGPEGYLITSPSTSPENKFIDPATGKAFATSVGGFADLAMIRECLADACNAALTLKTDPDFVAEIDKTIPRLQPYKIGGNGQLQEWLIDFKEEDPQHRHQSHLYGLYPGNHISLTKTPELAKAAAKSLEIKGDNTTGWSTGWRVNLLARLQEADKAYSMYRRLLKYVSPDNYRGPDRRTGGGTYPNLLDAHSPFQIDGNFGGTAGVAEMLMQSTPTSITLMPALPEKWQTGSFKGLKARGAYEVDADWKDGKVTKVTIHSEHGGKTLLHVNNQLIVVTLAPGATRTVKF